MIVSRLWYLALSLALAALVFLLFIATSVSNRNAELASGKLLSATSRAVYWYLTDDARRRAGALVELSVDANVQNALGKASGSKKLSDVKSELREKVAKRLRRFRKKHDKSLQFYALWAVDRRGRVVASENFADGTDSEHFEMGGYPVVADAIHGWIRDDTWVLNGQLHRVVAHPVETVVGGEPVGAIVTSTVINDQFANAVSNSTNTAVAFFAGGTRVSSGKPEGSNFNKSLLEVTSKDLKEIETDKDYQTKGRTAPRVLRHSIGTEIGVVFARMPGEAWDQGAGYIVGNQRITVSNPIEFQALATEGDKQSVPWLVILLGTVSVAFLGLFFSFLEHSKPLGKFKLAVEALGDKNSNVDVLKPNTFRGPFKRLAANINDALDKAASAAGVERGPADLESVLGPLPAQPQMSAFTVPTSTPPSESSKTKVSAGADSPSPDSDAMKTRVASVPTEIAEAEQDHDRTVVMGAAPSTAPPSPPRNTERMDDSLDEEVQWRQVYADFVALKKDLGESTDRMSYEKFRGTLQRNKDAIMSRHNCSRVKFRVYEKQGRAALKASPVLEA